LLILKLDEKEDDQQEKYINKNEQVKLECEQIDLQLENEVELFFDLEIIEHSKFQ
jgi:hypothetical protein